MSKAIWKPGTILNPVPVVMVSCAPKDGGKPNIITIAWAGTINSDPPMLSISVRKERHSYNIIKESGEFVVNLTTEALVRATDLCGVKSGKDTDKFALAGLTAAKASKVSCPIIAESPVNIECIVRQVIPLGSHDMFIAEIVSVQVDEALIDDKGKLDLENSGLITYAHGKYRAIGKKDLGFFGYSVAKRKTVRRK